MSFQQPSWWSRFAAFSDPALEHQIKIVTDSHYVYVTCNCVSDDEVIGTTANVTESWEKFRAFHEG